MNRRTKLLPLHHLSVVLGLLLSACTGAQAAVPSAMPPTSPPTTLPPTATATFTPIPPTATPTAIPPTATPSPTPNLTETAAARATETAAPILAMIDSELRKHDRSTNEGHLGWLHDPLTINVNSYMESRSQTDYPDVIASDFVLQTDMTWKTSTGFAGCGLVLRGGSDLETGKQYRVYMARLQGLPLWDIEYYKNGRFIKNIAGDVLSASAMKSAQASTNRITIVVQGNKIAVYANGDRMGVFTDNNVTEGSVAFMAFQESGETACTFTNAWLWILK